MYNHSSKIQAYPFWHIKNLSLGVNRIRRHAPVHVILYTPETEAGKLALAEKIAQLHAEAVSRQINNQNCPSVQKKQLLEAIIAAAKNPER